MIIDFHAHIYPQKIAAKASRSISEFYNTPMAYDGLTSELISSGSAIGVKHYVVHSTATKPEQVVSINDFILAEIAKESRFIGFGTIHPDFPEAHTEITRLQNSGIQGIKLHPDFQKFEADSNKMDIIYEQLAAIQLPVLIHAGDLRFDFSGPRRIAHILDKHPTLLIVAAHFGGYTQWDEAFEFLAGKKLWFDTSSSLWKLNSVTACKMIQQHGAENFLFGSDFPMWNHTIELKRFLSLGLSDEDNQAILWENAAKLLKI